MQMLPLLVCLLLGAGPAAAGAPEGQAARHEVRAMWNHTGMGAYPGDWDRSAKLLAENGFNMILPNMLWGGAAHYASDVLPRSPEFYKYGDQIEQCCAVAKKYGIEVHVWKVNYNLLTAPKDFVAKLRRQGRTQVTVSGKPCDWLCPSHPDNRRMELESMLEVARKYPVDGLHFDYIRYPNRECCYCDGCRRRFEVESGRPVADWPKDCYSGARKKEYNDWRCRQITTLVEAISRQARMVRPGLKISAAVFGGYPGCRESVAQDWPAWIKAGYLDFVCPMDYTNSDDAFAGLVRNQMKLVAGRIPVYPGIGASSSMSKLTPNCVLGQIRLARQLGAGGFVIFNFNAETATTILPGLGLGKDKSTSAAAPTAVQLLPNPHFDQGNTAPLGWTLSGGQGRWVDRHVLEVTGNGNDSNQWQCNCHFVPGQLYRFQVRARGVGGGNEAVSGPVFANRDCALTGDWTWFGYVFRAPDNVSKDVLRVGQWHSPGSSQFDAVRLVPVMPVHAIVRPEGVSELFTLTAGRIQTVLGDGESVHAGRYMFSADFAHEGSNYHRTLQSATAAFNTNRWCLSGDNQVTYRFGLPGYTFRSADAKLTVSYHERGGCVAEISRDQKSWRPLATQNGLGTAAAQVPTDLLPAETLYLRIRPSTTNSSFQVNDIEFSGDLAGPQPPEGVGRTEFAEVADGSGDVSVKEIIFDNFEFTFNDRRINTTRARPQLRVITTENRVQAILPAVLSWQAAPWKADDERPTPAPEQYSPPVAGPAQDFVPGGPGNFLAEPTLPHPGRYSVRLTLRVADREVLTATVPLTLPDYYREDFGRRIETGGSGAELWWCESTWKVSRDRPAPEAASPAATLSAARNDREAVQVVVRPAKALRQLTAAAGSLVGPGGATIPAENVQVLRVYYHRVKTPTDETSVRDDWPDALPPMDKPLDLPAGKNQPLWVLVHVPTDAKPGDYTGTLNLKAEGWSAAVPLRLHVWNFALPERNDLETAWGLSPGNVFLYHGLKTEADQRRVWEMYLQNFAEHRISPYDPAPLDPIRVKFLPEADPPRAELDFTAFDAEMTRVIGKYHFTNFRLDIQGMGGGTYQGRIEPSIAGFAESTPQYQAMFSSYVKQLEAHLREKGWLKMAYVYWFDEPQPRDYAFVQAGTDRLKKYAPGLQTFITNHQLQSGWKGTIDIWCPISFNYDHAKAEVRRAHGERFWWYVCCAPHAPYCTLFIDHPATDLRVWLWQTWQRKIGGVLVWESDYWTSGGGPVQDPYEDPMSYVQGTRPEEHQHWGNGDGRFVYPPLAAAAPGISGGKPVIEPPVSSIRWEMLREGVEDYEYLWLLRDLVAKKRSSLPAERLRAYESLLEVPDAVSRNATTFTTDPAPVYARRAAVAEAIEELAK